MRTYFKTDFLECAIITAAIFSNWHWVDICKLYVGIQIMQFWRYSLAEEGKEMYNLDITVLRQASQHKITYADVFDVSHVAYEIKVCRC